MRSIFTIISAWFEMLGRPLFAEGDLRGQITWPRRLIVGSYEGKARRLVERVRVSSYEIAARAARSGL
jgi:hypothetical protein